MCVIIAKRSPECTSEVHAYCFLANASPLLKDVNRSQGSDLDMEPGLLGSETDSCRRAQLTDPLL